MVPRSSSGVLGPSVGLQFPLLSGDWKTSRSSSVSRLWIRFSSSLFWSLLHWRHLSVVVPASAGDFCLSGLWASDCGLPRWRRIHARVWLSPVFLSFGSGGRRRLGTLDALCIGRNLFRSILASSRLCCGFSAGLCRSCLASPSRCLSEYALSCHRLVSLRCGCV